MQDALNVAAHIAYRGDIISFVSQYPQRTHTAGTAAKEGGEFAHAREWY